MTQDFTTGSRRCGLLSFSDRSRKDRPDIHKPITSLFGCSDPEWRRQFLHLALHRERHIAKVAMARKLAVRLFWTWRNEKFGSHVGQPETALGAH